MVSNSTMIVRGKERKKERKKKKSHFTYTREHPSKWNQVSHTELLKVIIYIYSYIFYKNQNPICISFIKKYMPLGTL